MGNEIYEIRNGIFLYYGFQNGNNQLNIRLQPHSDSCFLPDSRTLILKGYVGIAQYR